jgi:beta-lactamase regulating signal transducer with metallopeptidase domain
MSVLIAIALKSLLVAGLTLALLALMKHRSAAERSWVAHIGLLALIIMAFAPLVLPSWSVEAPALLGTTPAIDAAAQPVAAAAPTAATQTPLAATHAASQPAISAAAAASAIYAVPAAILLFITFLALARLIALRARAEVLVDGHWLTALARAQRRMGFKHGTALLTSNALASPISWGLMRPVILLNTRAVEASDEAEAIIAHELAHVARMDWAKLLLARIATALFWFNPLVWILAREAHQLREETADDAVLAANIVDTDYAQLLVGVARHECPGLLLGAHGVAPSKSSLARRVARVLDGKSVRGPTARGFAAGVLVGAILVAAPLAALTLTPGGPKLTSPQTATVGKEQRYAYHPAHPATPEPAAPPADLASIIAGGVSTAVTVAKAQAGGTLVSADGSTVATNNGKVMIRDPHGKLVTIDRGKTVLRGADGKTVTVFPADASGRRRVVVNGPHGSVVTYADADKLGEFDFDFDFVPPAPPAPPAPPHVSAIDRAAELKAVGASPAYVAAIRSAAPRLRLDHEDIVQFAAVGVTPDYLRALAQAGYARVSAEDVVQARASGVSANYARDMAAAGYAHIPLGKLIELKSVGVTPADVSAFRRSGRGLPSVDEMVKAKALGLRPEDVAAVNPG